MIMVSDDDFIRGIELFNAGRYFESHELLEKVWLRTEGEGKAILQGLIQATAALLHLERGNLIGARSLILKSVKNLASAPDQFRGIRLTGFIAVLERFVAGDSSVPAQLTPSDPSFEEKLSKAESIIRRYRKTLRALSK